MESRTPTNGKKDWVKFKLTYIHHNLSKWKVITSICTTFRENTLKITSSCINQNTHDSCFKGNTVDYHWNSSLCKFEITKIRWIP